MANLTITVDDDTLRRARIRALRREESVNAYLARILRRYADEENSAMDDVIALAHESRAGSDATGRSWTRDEAHRG